MARLSRPPSKVSLAVVTVTIALLWTAADAQALGNAAHASKGVAANIGAEPVRRIAECLARMGRLVEEIRDITNAEVVP